VSDASSWPCWAKSLLAANTSGCPVPLGRGPHRWEPLPYSRGLPTSYFERGRFGRRTRRRALVGAIQLPAFAELSNTRRRGVGDVAMKVHQCCSAPRIDPTAWCPRPRSRSFPGGWQTCVRATKGWAKPSLLSFRGSGDCLDATHGGTRKRDAVVEFIFPTVWDIAAIRSPLVRKSGGLLYSFVPSGRYPEMRN